MNEDTVTIPLSEYKRLLQDQRFLRALEAAGVDNWDGYRYAFGRDDDESEEEIYGPNPV